MNIFEINGNTGKSKILIGERIENLEGYLPPLPRVIITDNHVHRLYGDLFPHAPVIDIGTGEGIKTLGTVMDIFQKLVALEADRSLFLVGIGGGIVCDVTGFVASTYLRGIRFGFAATTLLAQVDASVGGKNGVNFSGYKNMVGVFNQPEFVLCDPRVLTTLSHQERGCGLAEVVKHAAIADQDLFRYMEENIHQILGQRPEALERMVLDSVVIKSSIVNRDEKEQGERRKLNFGHTFGHALEKVHGLPHGEAVSVGMVAAARLSEQKGYLTKSDVNRLLDLLTALKLPTAVAFERAQVLDALRHDKKRKEDIIHFVLLHGIGNATVEPVSLSELTTVLMQIL